MCSESHCLCSLKVSYSPARAGVASLVTHSLSNRQRRHGLVRCDPLPWQPDRRSSKINVISMDRDSGHSNMGSSWVLRSCRVYSSANCNMHGTFSTEWTPHACANRKALILRWRSATLCSPYALTTPLRLQDSVTVARRCHIFSTKFEHKIICSVSGNIWNIKNALNIAEWGFKRQKRLIKNVDVGRHDPEQDIWEIIEEGMLNYFWPEKYCKEGKKKKKKQITSSVSFLTRPSPDQAVCEERHRKGYLPCAAGRWTWLSDSSCKEVKPRCALFILWPAATRSASVVFHPGNSKNGMEQLISS